MKTYDQIHAVDMATVPVMSTDRSIPRKEQAALTRHLFRRLGIKGVSVTAPNYSMAHTVDVNLPNEPTPNKAGYEQYQHISYLDMSNDTTLDRVNAPSLQTVFLARIDTMHTIAGDTVRVKLDFEFLPFALPTFLVRDTEIIRKDLRIGDTVEFSVDDSSGLPEVYIHRFVPEMRPLSAEPGIPRNITRLGGYRVTTIS